ncbi:hypothetical protein ABMY26_17665 [Azospirillum sp. HJ39]|uniref:hypothetical protein n=1 Tax=Azospirillum sp. HJ39 TaxID=3159496 RepID=UPI0035576497
MANWEVIYYPSMSVPEDDWFGQFVLYFNSCGIIVPWRGFDEEQSETTKELSQTNFIKPICPMEHFNWNEDSDRRLIELLKTVKRSREEEKIHLGKLNYGQIIYEMEIMKIARKDPKSQWYFVSKPHANIVMTYLAMQLGRQESVCMTPATGSLSAARLLADLPPSAMKSNGGEVGDLLRKLFVCPIGVDLRDLMDFKENHSLALKNYQEEIDRIMSLDGALIPGELRRMVEVRDEILGLMNRKFFNGFCFSDFAYVSLGGIASFYEESPIGGAISLMTPVVKQLVIEGRSWNKRNRLMDNPAAYAALSHQFSRT